MKAEVEAEVRERIAKEIDARREHVEELDDDARRRLADAAKAFQELPLSRRHDIVELARALSERDPELAASYGF